ncbi:MAG TPA: hypothetical protein VFO96_01560 [Gemmatimonadales bacterium]|nr:hypothetical protein [Gemmatimonadales bacterium]
MMRRFGNMVLMLSVGSVTACDTPRTPPASAAAGIAVQPHQVTVVARNYAYQMPDTLASGLTTFHLINKGTEPHHLMFYRLDAGKTMSDAFAELKTGGPLPSWMHPVGGPNAPAPGNDAWATVSLAPGHYMAFCHIPSRDHILHLAKGMMKDLMVVPAGGPRASMPPADLSVTLTDYAFNFSRTPVAGPQTVAIINQGTDTHELILSKLDPGKTAQDFVNWINKQDGPPPVTPYGGVTDIAPGDTILARIDFTPGNYSVTCRVRAATDSVTHDLHGMNMGFTVQ